mmetsp:Transcript_29911/g.62177  ORF Transcript_29911/g.62177 Transcript_29911/m.62177 type:complete len:84 (+) Transcript_29911:80-331(+)
MIEFPTNSNLIHYDPFNLTTSSIIYPNILVACIPFAFITIAYFVFIYLARIRVENARSSKFHAIPNRRFDNIKDPAAPIRSRF